MRFSVRLYYESITRELSRENKKCILIYGAGAAGVTLVREIHSNPTLGYRVVGFLDDQRQEAPRGPGRRAGAGVRARRAAHRGALPPHGASRIQEIVIAMPSATGRQMREALANCRAAGVPVKTIPGMGELLNGKVLTSQIRDVSVLDLLGREPVQLDETPYPHLHPGHAPSWSRAAAAPSARSCAGRSPASGRPQLVDLRAVRKRPVPHSQRAVGAVSGRGDRAADRRYPRVRRGWRRSSGGTPSTPSSTPPPTSTCP